MEEPPPVDPFLECQEQMRNFEINDRPPSFRHSRAFRNFKNPPQPHMCIRDTTADGDHEVLINVMSWTRIVKPQTANDPIPLYGGMRVLASSSSNRSPTQQKKAAMLFAVMANPEVLKKASRNSVDDQDLTALVELMCEFVEAMNPGLKLLRQPTVLKDRDLSGELKNIWGAVQAKRETEREQFMTGKHNPNLVVYTELGPETSPAMGSQLEEQYADDLPNTGVTATRLHGEGISVAANITDNGGDTSCTADHADSVNANSNHSSLSNVDRTPLSSLNDHSSRNGDSLAFNKTNNGLSEDRTRDTTGREEEKEYNREGNTRSQNNTENVPQGSKVAQEIDCNGLRMTNQQQAAQEPPLAAAPLPVSTTTTTTLGKSNGKAEKEVANVKEKKEKSISGFLNSGLFGKRNKDSSGGGATKEKSRVKLGSFKSKLLMGGGSNKEKTDKGNDANPKKMQLRASSGVGGGGEDDVKVQFSEIGQSMATAK